MCLVVLIGFCCELCGDENAVFCFVVSEECVCVCVCVCVENLLVKFVP